MLPQLLLLLSVLNPLQAIDPIEQYRSAAVAKWESTIVELEKLDQQESDPEHAILFVGSSSIRLWEAIQQDMAPYPVIRRGYGGAKFSDLAVYIDRLVKPHQFDAAVVFVANDIAGADDDKSPEEVVRLFDYTVKRIKQHAPAAPVLLIAITPTPSRFAVWDRIHRANTLLAEYCEQHAGVSFIDTTESFLDAKKQPIADYFVEDRLHLNHSGYALWASSIKEALDEVLPADGTGEALEAEPAAVGASPVESKVECGTR